MSASLQSIPQNVEVPPNSEAKRIITYFFAVLSGESNQLLLNDESKLPFSLACWQASCGSDLCDPGHSTLKRGIGRI